MQEILNESLRRGNLDEVSRFLKEALLGNQNQQQQQNQSSEIVGVSIPIAKGYIKQLADHILSISISSSTIAYIRALVSLSEQTLSLLQPRIYYFEEVDMLLRDAIVEKIVDDPDQPDCSRAAKILSGINMDANSSGKFTDAERAKRYVRIAELYLEDDDTVEAEIFVNRAAQFIHTSPDQSVKTRFNVSYSRILDSKRKFIDAAFRYYELSTITHIPVSITAETMEVENMGTEQQQVSEDDLMHILSKSIICAILASAGPQKSKLLQILYNDQRAKNIDWCYPILQKMRFETLLRQEDLKVFESKLEPHQKATLSDGSTVLERAVHEHNMLAVAKIYVNISFADLARHLELDSSKAQKIASRMISENRLIASIDQVDSIIDFTIPSQSNLQNDLANGNLKEPQQKTESKKDEFQSSGANFTGAISLTSSQAMDQFHRSISTFLNGVNKINDMIRQNDKP